MGGAKNTKYMIDRNTMDALKERYTRASNEAEREAVMAEIRACCEEDSDAVLALAVEQIKEAHEEIDNYLVRKQMEHILPCISLAYIAETYFKKSRHWLYQRVNGLLVNGKPAKFTAQELETLNFALHDIGERLVETRVS